MSVFSAMVSLLRARKACRHSLLPLIVACLLLPAAASRAQTATFSGPPSLVNGVGNLYPTGVAVDANGYIYVANGPGGSTSTEILKITPGGSSSVLNLSGYTLTAALGLAVDNSGYLYIADCPLDGNNADNRVLKVKTDGSSASVIPAGTLYGPAAVAVDASGNVYIADNNNGARVVKVPYSGGTYGSHTDFVSTSESIGSGGALEYGVALAVDASGDVLLTDTDGLGARLIKVTSSGTATELISNTQSIGAGGTLYTPNGVAADAQGDIFVADQESTDFLGRIVELPYSGGSYGSPVEYVPSTGNASTNALNTPNGLAIDSKGNLYATDFGADAENSAGTGGVIEIASQSTDFGNATVGSSSLTYSLNFVFGSGGSLNSTTPYKVLTLGASGLDFAAASGTNCSGSFGAGSTCTVKVKFSPKYTGLRIGAVELLNTSGSVIVTANLYGIGTGPQVVFPSNAATGTPLGGTFAFSGMGGSPLAVTVDGSGNVYVADQSGAVYEMPAGCALSSCVTTLGSGFEQVTGVAVDGSGNVYVVDTSLAKVYEMPAGCASSSCMTALGGGFQQPYGVMVDGSGNVYVSNEVSGGTVNGTITKMPPGCTSTAYSSGACTVTTLSAGFRFPEGIAMDASGNIYVVDAYYTSQQVTEVPAGCTSSSCATTLAGGFKFNYPQGVAVDASGNVYVAVSGAVQEMPAGCASSSCVTTLVNGNGNFYPDGVALDGSGNLYAVGGGTYSVQEFPLATPPILTFSSTMVGQTSSAQTVTLANIGNAALTFPIPSTGNNPSVAANFALGVSTTCPELDSFSSAGTLAAGASCTLAVQFEPTDTGSIDGSLIVKDNHLNAASPNYTTQSISLSGTGSAVVPGAPTIGTATAGDTQVTVTFTPPASDGGAAITDYTAISSPGALTGTCAASPCVVTGLSNGTAYTFTVTATNSVGTGAASSASNSVTPQASQTITFNNPGAQNFGTSPTLTATASSGLTVTFSSSTTGVCTVTSGGTLTFVTAGTCTINANQAGNGAYLPATQMSQSFTVAAVVPGAPTIGTATAGNTQATVSFTAPAFTGGAAITGYTAISSPGGLTGTCAASPCVVTGLTNGTAYTFTVTATNSAGTGSSSAASGSVTPKASQTITFDNPGAQNFGTSPTLTATATSGLTVTFSSSTTGVCTVTSGGALTFVNAGTCTINADQAGNSAYQAASTVTQSFVIAAVVPGAPTIGAATAGEQQATVSFAPPVFNGGTAITGYTATSNPNGVTGTCASSPCVITGLQAGTSYTFTVTATNAAGTGAPSAASNAVTTPIPNLVVTTAADDAGTASNCTPQTSSGTGTDAACSLRDALLYAASAGAANISFDSTAFASATTITLNGALTVPANTAIAGTGTSQLLIDGNQAGNILQVASGVTASVSNLTLQNALGTSSQMGGAIYNAGTLTLSGVIVKNSKSGNNSGGAGIYNASTGGLTLTNCTLADDISSYTGFGSSGYGGGIANYGGAVNITACTFTGDEASMVGGGIYTSGGTVSIASSTLTGATGTSTGGGIGVHGGSVSITNSTIAGNHASGNAGGIYISTGTVSLSGTVLAANTDGSGTPDGGGAFTDGGHNLIGNGTGISGITNGVNNDLVGTSPSPINPLLAALGSYGGPTQTMIPLPGSPAICAISPSSASGTDQRGYARTTTYGSKTCEDLGAAQTNYSLSFSTQPSPISPASAIFVATNFQAAVTLDESGSALTASSVAIPLTLTPGSGTLSGGSASTSAGVAAYSTLSVSAPGAGDVLTATLSLNPSAALSLTAASNLFNVTSITPTVTGISPSIGPFAGGTSVTITGTNFTGATSVLFGSTAASSFTVNSGTQITATAPAAIAGTVDVTVTTSAGTSTTSAADQFTYLAAPSISISFSSASIVLGTPATLTFTLTNSNSATSLTGIGFSNTLPSGLVFATPANLMNTCGGTAASTGTTISLSAATLSAGASCNVTIQIAGNSVGSHTDTTSTVTSTQTVPGAAGSATLTVTAATVTASVTAASRTYNGSASATITGCTLTGVLAADTGNVSCSASGASFASSGAANGITVTASGISLSGSAAGNYTLASTTATTSANITQAPLTVTASNTSTTYGTAPSVTPAYSAFAGSDTPTSLTTAPRCVSTVTGSTPVGGYTGANTCAGAVDANYSFTYVAGNATVTQGAQTIHFTAPSSPVVYGVSPIALSATATSGLPVTFSVISGPGTISGNTLTIIGVGSIVIAADQAGNQNYTRAAQVTQSVAAAQAALTVAANNATKIYGTANPAFSGSVSGAESGDTFTESFSTTATTNSNVGMYIIVPSAAGSNLGDYAETIQNGTLTVTQAGSAVALTSSTTNANLNANVTFTAAVTSATTGTPTGTVEFLDGSTMLGTATLNSTGVASYTTANLTAGSRTINAVYAGDQNFTGSSIALAQLVTAPDYSLTANPTALTLKAGQTGEVTFTFTPVGGYTGTVNFACAGLPANASCSFAPTSLTADGSNRPQTSQLTITTEGPNSGTVGSNESQGAGGVTAGSIFWLPGLLLGCFLLWQRKKLSASTQRLLGVVVLVAAICWATGCGFAPPQAPGGAHAVTVTATATASASGSGSGSSNGATSHTATFMLTITQ